MEARQIDLTTLMTRLSKLQFLTQMSALVVVASEKNLEPEKNFMYSMIKRTIDQADRTAVTCSPTKRIGE